MSSYWPFFGIRVRTPRLELCYPDDEALHELATLATLGVHDPDQMPFSIPWTRASSPQLERGVLQYNWSRRATLSADDWGLPMVVSEAGVIVGVQEVFAEDFRITRTVETGSWLVQSAQGRGIGTEMRSAVLHLAFDGLGAREALSASFDDNPRSERVSRALGYEPNGTLLVVREGVAARSNRWRLTRERWLERRPTGITVEGIDPCLALLGASDAR